MYLENINDPKDLRQLSLKELRILSKEIRNYIIGIVSKNGGHLAPNLGTLELTIALHYHFNTPFDKLVWDVGHQAYTHKILTGRREAFKTLRKFGGISGFLKRDESIYDVFEAGHAGTSLSAAAGLATARDLKHKDYKVVAVIGDGALISGMALEALNHIGASNTDITIILNDNKMSIGKNPGAISKYLNRLITSNIYKNIRNKIWNFISKTSKQKRALYRKWGRFFERLLKMLFMQASLFEELGFHYFGPVDGHCIKDLLEILKRVNGYSGPILIHVVTEKGHGYKKAVEDPEKYHGIKPAVNNPTKISNSPPETYSSAFGKYMIEFARKDNKIIALTAGMALGTGLKEFREEFPLRFFDTGITEEHTVTFSGALALEGFKPVFAVYSTFLQRGYDQIIHDVALQKLPVVFALDRAGLVGADGPTHHGTFDISYLLPIPNTVIAAPMDAIELKNLLYTAINYSKGPFFLRYPRDKIDKINTAPPKTIQIGKWSILKHGKDGVIIATGSMVKTAKVVINALKERGIELMLINARFIKPVDINMIEETINQFSKIFTIEENVFTGGFGTYLKTYVPSITQIFALPDKFIEQGSRTELLRLVELDKESIVRRILSFF